MAAASGLNIDAGMMALQQTRVSAGEAAAKRLNALPHNTMRHAEARKTADEFESMFLSQMLQHMSSGIKTDGPFGGGPGEEMFRSLLNQEYAGMLAKRGGIGLADHVYRQILALQEA